ncbi:hypothetical protein SAMN05216359_10682 [Roseateles sp. YR242]|nr:hypothetical protein SAMN05216359_10682 [Roseateles sp. YR242]
MLTMAWGFMPVRIRGSLGPQSTQLLLGVVAGLMHGMQRKKAARKEQRPEADQHAQAAEAQAQARQAGASVRGGSAAAPAAPKAVPPVSPTSS